MIINAFYVKILIFAPMTWKQKACGKRIAVGVRKKTFLKAKTGQRKENGIDRSGTETYKYFFDENTIHSIPLEHPKSW